jgi:hypothetical protein
MAEAATNVTLDRDDWRCFISDVCFLSIEVCLLSRWRVKFGNRDRQGCAVVPDGLQANPTANPIKKISWEKT